MAQWQLTPWRAFVVFSAGALLAGLLFQWAVLPASSWHAGHGLMAGGDWVSFYEQAQRLALQIRSTGWDAWQLRFEGQWPASLMASLFVLTGWEHPTVVLPVYALLYGATAMAGVHVASWLGVKGRGLWATLAVLAFPSTVLIYGQPHKDVFSLAGFGLLAAAWGMAWKGTGWLRWGIVAAGVAMALGLIWLPRPYLLDIVTVAVLAAGVLAIGIHPARRRFVTMIILFVSLVVAWGRVYQRLDVHVQPVQLPVQPVQLCDGWQPEWVIHVLHERVGQLVCYRQGFLYSYQGQAGTMDFDYKMSNYWSLLSYLPRATLLASTAPWPRWSAFTGEVVATSPGGKVKRLIAAGEMLAYYGMALGAIFLFVGYGQITDGNLRTWVVALLVFFLAIAVFYVLTSPNEGTLYRMRYPAMVIWWVLGCAGWYRWIQGKKAIFATTPRFQP